MSQSVKSVDNTPHPRPALLQDVLAEVKQALRRLYGPRLKQVILYGSWARGDATSDSDIDVAIVLKDAVSPATEIDRTVDLVFDLNLKYGVLISVYPVSEDEYRSLQSPLLMNVRREGVPA
jgi:predicted nucleotidyltransferase